MKRLRDEVKVKVRSRGNGRGRVSRKVVLLVCKSYGTTFNTEATLTLEDAEELVINIESAIEQYKTMDVVKA